MISIVSSVAHSANALKDKENRTSGPTKPVARATRATTDRRSAGVGKHSIRLRSPAKKPYK